MRRALFCLFLALVSGCGPRAPASLPPPPSPALWRISDADSEIWLFGTAHLLRPRLPWRSPQVSHALASSGELVLEADIRPENQPSFALIARREGTLAPGETLSAKLNPDDRAALARVVQDLRLDANAIERERPWLAALELSVTEAAAQGERPEAGVEPALLAEAQRRQMRLSFFETPEQQILILADLPEADAVRFLGATIRDVEAGAPSDAQIERAWATGDVAALGRLFDGQLQEAGPVVRDALITRRNAVWADDIVRRLNGSGHIFIAVGAAHLAGPDSVVALLRARGVKVEGP